MTCEGILTVRDVHVVRSAFTPGQDIGSVSKGNTRHCRSLASHGVSALSKCWTRDVVQKDVRWQSDLAPGWPAEVVGALKHKIHKIYKKSGTRKLQGRGGSM